MTAKFDETTKLWESVKVPYSLPLDVYIGDVIFASLGKNPNRVVQIFDDDVCKLTCRDLKLSSSRVGQNLTNLGIYPDDVVTVVCRNSNFITSLFYGCIFHGAVINALNIEFSKSDLEHFFNQSKPRLIVCDAEFYLKVRSALKSAKIDAFILIASGIIPEVRSVDELLTPTGTEEQYKPAKFTKLATEKLFSIMCSSGTTGLPKGVNCYHSSVLSLLGSVKSLITNANASVSLCFSPLYWVSGFFQIILSAFAENDYRVVTSKDFNIDNFIYLVETYKVTKMIMPPSHLASLLQSRTFLSSDNSTLNNITVAGGIVSQNLRQKFHELFKGEKQLQVAYGMTEGSISMTAPNEYLDGLNVGSIILPNTTIKIVDENGNQLGIGEHGEICIKQLFKFAGYYNNPEATANAIDSVGFYKSGDIGFINEKNALFVVDRKKEIMKVNGHHLNPSEIENVIEEIDGIAMVSVVGIPDAIIGNYITAAVVGRPGIVVTVKKIIEHVASRLADFKHLRGGVYFFDELPLTANGKINKKLIREMLLEKFENKTT